MKKKKWTPEERRAWQAEREATQRMLLERIERIKAELKEPKRSR